jgi:hypothetical protein
MIARGGEHLGVHLAARAGFVTADRVGGVAAEPIRADPRPPTAGPVDHVTESEADVLTGGPRDDEPEARLVQQPPRDELGHVPGPIPSDHWVGSLTR